jgi:hypothetical protein
MKIYNDDYFIEDDTRCYTNDTKITSGYLLSRTRSPHTIIDKGDSKKDDSGWFPDIIVAKPSLFQPVELMGSKILANTPCYAWEFMYTLMEVDTTVIKLPKAFKSEYCSYDRDKKDVYINFINLTGKIDPGGFKGKEGNFIGGFCYDDTHYREITLHCDRWELKTIFKLLLMLPVGVSYDLEYSAPACATPRRKGSIHPIEYEIDKKKMKSYGLRRLIV